MQTGSIPVPSGNPLDALSREREIRALIERKAALRAFYDSMYARYARCAAAAAPEGVLLELGSGGGYAKRKIPGLLTSDVLPYEGVDCVVDATRMQFGDSTLRAILMLNTFHHIPDVAAFLREATRCLKPRGRLLILDQHVGPVSWPILKWLHHEPFDPGAKQWGFPSSGPVSGANGALAWMVFRRDRARLEAQHPGLRLLRYEPNTPLLYWLAGGLRSWSLVPAGLVGLARALDRLLLAISTNLGSFVEIELVRAEAEGP